MTAESTYLIDPKRIRPKRNITRFFFNVIVLTIAIVLVLTMAIVLVLATAIANIFIYIKYFIPSAKATGPDYYKNSLTAVISSKLTKAR